MDVITAGATRPPEQRRKWWTPLQLAFPFSKPEATTKQRWTTPQKLDCVLHDAPALFPEALPALVAMAHGHGGAGLGSLTCNARAHAHPWARLGLPLGSSSPEGWEERSPKAWEGMRIFVEEGQILQRWLLVASLP